MKVTTNNSLLQFIKLVKSALNGKASSSHTHDISNINDLQYTLDGKLDKTSFEYNKELILYDSGRVCIGKFPCHDTNISVEIKSTTNTTFNGTLIIATQNINHSSGGVYKAVVYGDENNTLTDSIKIEYLSGSRAFSVYIDLPLWSKNLLHIQCAALRGTPTDIATIVDSIPSTATIVPTNALNYSYYKKTETYSKNEIDTKLGDIETALTNLLGV